MLLPGAAMREGLGAAVEDGCLQGTSSDLRDRQVPVVTCHSQDVGREKGQTHLVSRKALAVQACSGLAGDAHDQLGCRVPHEGFANTCIQLLKNKHNSESILEHSWFLPPSFAPPLASHLAS